MERIVTYADADFFTLHTFHDRKESAGCFCAVVEIKQAAGAMEHYFQLR